MTILDPTMLYDYWCATKKRNRNEQENHPAAVEPILLVRDDVLIINE